jgi:hypothetical protein
MDRVIASIPGGRKNEIDSQLTEARKKTPGRLMKNGKKIPCFGVAGSVARPSNAKSHWLHALSIRVAGGGRKCGDIIGATNSRGEHPVTWRYHPHDLLGTTYHYLAIDPKREYLDLSGRPIPLTRGEPIEELL